MRLLQRRLVSLLALAIACLLLLRLVDPRSVAAILLGQLVFTVCYGLLLRAFALSLRPGREPLITGIARRMRTEMPPEIERYTRAVTLLWVTVFALQLAVSFLLLLFAPVAWWSSFVVWISPALVVATLVIEFVVRRIRLRHHPRDRLRDVAKVLRMTMSAAGK